MLRRRISQSSEDTADFFFRRSTPPPVVSIITVELDETAGGISFVLKAMFEEKKLWAENIRYGRLRAGESSRAEATLSAFIPLKKDSRGRKVT